MMDIGIHHEVITLSFTADLVHIDVALMCAVSNSFIQSPRWLVKGDPDQLPLGPRR